MKKSVSILVLTFALSAGAQNLKESAVPAIVKEAFKNQYPEIKKAEWEKEKDNYEAEFETKRVFVENGKAKKENIETSVVYNANGKMIETETEIPVSQLPKSVNEYISKNFAGKKITEAAKITDATGVITYEAEIGKKDLLFDVTGNYIKTEVD